MQNMLISVAFGILGGLHMTNHFKAPAVLSVIAGLLVAAVPMLAHHGTNISYDRSKMMTVKGTVTEFRFANPHPQLYVDVKDDTGKVTNWGCEIAANPYQLSLSGWGKQRSINELKPG